jgi:precorrin-6A/cobalt-precorrin-6A reductase
MLRVLVLGGTWEARQLAQRLGERRDFAVTLSFAGRTATPAAVSVPVRIGGFGGAEGLARYISAEDIDVLIDATHPYAAAISANCAHAAHLTSVRFLALRRPPWVPVEGDRWTEVDNVPAAVNALGEAPRRVFLALGRKELMPFVAAPQHYYVVRSVDPIDPPIELPNVDYLVGRGPYSEANDRALLAARQLEVVVAKNSGGTATYGKIAAARAFGLRVIMLRRPVLPAVPSVKTVEGAMAWLDHGDLPCAARGV